MWKEFIPQLENIAKEEGEFDMVIAASYGYLIHSKVIELYKDVSPPIPYILESFCYPPISIAYVQGSGPYKICPP